MADFSDEGNCKGLCLIPGEVKSLSSLEIKPTPHMGWNDVFLNSYYKKNFKKNNQVFDLFSERNFSTLFILFTLK